MKSGYKTIPDEEESKPLTKAGIAETGGSPIKKKHMVLVCLGLVIMGFLMGHLTNTQHSGLQMSQESIHTQLVNFKELADSKKDVSTLHLLEPKQSVQGIVVGKNLSLIHWRLSIAICLLLIY